MKCTSVFCLILGIFSLSTAIPIQTIQPGSERVTYMQYTQPSVASVRQISVAGPTIKVDGNILKETKDADRNGDIPKTVTSVAEAIDLPIEEDTETQSKQGFVEPFQLEEDDSKVGENGQRNFELSTNANDEPAINSTPVYANTLLEKKPTIPVVPVKKPSIRIVPPQKKIFVELETPEPESFYIPATRRVVGNNPSLGKAVTAKPNNGAEPVQVASGSFFPIDFGKTDSGVIAIANSFSTGEGGSATSTATAYGSSTGVGRSIRTRSG